MTVTITHGPTGTVADGTAKGDGTAPILKANGFRWAPSLGAWALPRPWHAGTRELRARAAVAALHAAGHDVALTVAAPGPAVTTAEQVALHVGMARPLTYPYGDIRAHRTAAQVAEIAATNTTN